MYRALAEFGAPLARVSADEFSKPELIYQLGVPPSGIDILTSRTGLAFEDAWPRRNEADFDGIPATFVNIEDLMRNKRAVSRDSDFIDCKRLEDVLRNKPRTV